MTIDFWGLGLQAINVLILAWLLSRVFWRPVAEAIDRRRNSARATLDAANTTHAKADATLAEVNEARSGIEAERTAILAGAATQAQADAKALLADAQGQADLLLASAQTSIARDTETARKDNVAQASSLAVDIAARLLGRLNSPLVQTAFRALLIETITDMSPSERAALVASPAGIEIVTTDTLAAEDKQSIQTAIISALGGTPELTFVTDPDLIAGVELRSAHFILHNSWRAGLTTLLKEMAGLKEVRNVV